MLIDHANRFIFVHIPKAAGTSITAALGGYEKRETQELHGHLTIREAMAVVPEWRKYYKFGFIRNPFDRLVSIYHYCQQHEAHPAHKAAQDWTFDNFIDAWSADPRWSMPQVEYLCGKRHVALVDNVGRYENLEADFDRICRAIGVSARLQKLNSSHHIRWQEYYTERRKRRVYELVAADCECFGY